jgi:Ribonuclease G/E
MLDLYCSTMTQRRWAALLDGSTLIGFAVEAATTDLRFADVYVAVLRNLDKARGFATVELGGGLSALLDLPRNRKLPTIGSKLLVQVRRTARRNKMAKVSDRIRLLSRPVGPDFFWASGLARTARTSAANTTPDRNGDPIEVSQPDAAFDALASAAGAASMPGLLLREQDCLGDLLMRFPEAQSSSMRCDARAAVDRWNRQFSSQGAAANIEIRFEPERDWRLRRTDIVDTVRDALQPEQALPGGGALLLESGETLTAIDVNADRRSHPSGEEQLAYRINEIATSEIARLVRLLNLSGNIVIDFMGMRPAGRRRAIADKLRAAFANDPASPWVGGMSPLGLVEVGRQNLGPDLYEAFAAPCGRCAGRGLEIESLEALTRSP